MMLCAHQPVYLPSMHLFNKISLCDGVVLLGHCQYVKQSWHSRNQIRAGKGKMFLTVPVRHANKLELENTLISNDYWKRKQCRSIKETYSKRPYFDQYFPDIEAIINRPHETLVELNNALIVKFMAWLDLSPKIYHSEDMAIEGLKTDMLINLCQLTGADAYVSNVGASAYLKEEQFTENGIQHYWQDFAHPTYDQGKEFIPNLSIIDAFFNVGPNCADMIRKSGSLSPCLPL